MAFPPMGMKLKFPKVAVGPKNDPQIVGNTRSLVMTVINVWQKKKKNIIGNYCFFNYWENHNNILW